MHSFRALTAPVLCVIASLSIACMPSDDRLAREVRTLLQNNPATKDLSVTVNHRVIYLSGGTNTREQQETAVQLVNSVANVKLVVNDMWLNDVDLARRVKQALAADEAVAKIPIEVDAREGLVRLMSDQTTAEERARIVKIASGVPGVEHVEDRMR